MIDSSTPLPSFSLPDDSGNNVSDQSIQGSWTLLYFYPKDETSGCTAEACSFRDNTEAFKALGLKVYGISGDSVKSHQKFKTNHQLSFPLLADTDHAMAEAFGTWIEKSMYGKKYMGMERSTALISPAGKIVATFIKVEPVGHAEYLLEKIKPYLNQK